MEARLTHCGSSESWAEDCRTKTRQWHPHPNSERTCDPCGRASQCKSFSARLQQTRNFLRQNPRSLRSRGRVLPFSESLLEVSQGLLLALHVRLLQKPFSQKLRSKGAKLRGERRRGASPRAARAKTFKGLFAPVASSPSVRYALGCARSSAARRLGSGPRGPTGPPRIGDRPSSVLRHPPRSRHSPTRPAVPRNLRAPVAGASAPESSRKPQGKTPNFGRPRGHARLR